MPIPTPDNGEKKKSFIQRCMGDDVMVKEYPDTSRRYAICINEWIRYVNEKISEILLSFRESNKNK